jgi:membrane-associated protease RseP (regulator of RpoE activity)
MEDTTRSRRTLYIVLVVIGLLISCGLGALLGGTAGFLIGRRSAVDTLGRGLGPGMMPRIVTPAPVVPGAPRMTPRAGTPMTGEGAAIMTVVQGGPAEAAGLRRGDIIVAVDDQAVNQNNELRDVLAKYRPGDTVNLTVRRDTDDLKIPVQLGANPDASTTPWLGISYITLAPGE